MYVDYWLQSFVDSNALALMVQHEKPSPSASISNKLFLNHLLIVSSKTLPDIRFVSADATLAVTLLAFQSLHDYKASSFPISLSPC